MLSQLMEQLNKANARVSLLQEMKLTHNQHIATFERYAAVMDDQWMDAAEAAKRLDVTTAGVVRTCKRWAKMNLAEGRSTKVKGPSGRAKVIYSFKLNLG